MPHLALPAALLACSSVASAALLIHLPYDGDATNGGSTGGINDGSLAGGTSFTAGKLGQAVIFDGNGDYINHGSSPIAGNGSRTVSAWIKTAPSAAGLRSILSFGSNSNGGKFDFDIDNNNGGHLEIGVGSGRTNGAGGPAVNNETWRLVTVTLSQGGDRDDLRFFIDGFFAADTAGNSNDPIATNSSGIFYIGSAANTPGTQSFNGSIDDVAIWDEVLSDVDIAALYAVATSTLEYNAGNYGALKVVHDTGSGSAVINETLAWTFAEELTGVAGLSGTSPNFTLIIDEAKGTGLVSATPPDPDSDNDGLLDQWELDHFMDLDEIGTGDPDMDGRTNEQEETDGTDPSNSDTDQDGSDDGDEATRGTDPFNPDSDDDGLPDGSETNTGTFVNDTNTGSDPLDTDSDDDGLPDGIEVDQERDPNIAGGGTRRPNVIYILVDDLGYGDLGCFWQDDKSGTQKFDTPEIDRMAAEGIKLTHHYVSSPVCAPSRASLLSGRHQGHANIRNSQFDKVLEDNHTIARMMQSAGYYTAHIGKNGVAGGEGAGTNPGHPLLRGFDYFLGYLYHGDGHEHYPRNGTTDKTAYIWENQTRITDAYQDVYTTDIFTARAKKTIIDETNNNPDRPFFIYLAYDSPHFKMQYPPAAYPSGKGTTGGLKWTGSPSYCNTATDGAIDDYVHPDFSRTTWPTSNKKHAGMIRRIDNGVGDILQTLRDLEIDDNTIVVFSSDNGPHNEGNNPRFFESYANLDGIKRDMWEAGIRVPTVAWWPRKIGDNNSATPPAETAYPSAIWDWMPTFAEAAEVPAPAWCDGVSLLPDMTGNGNQRDKGYLYFEFQNGSNTPNWTQFEASRRNRARGQMQVVRVGDLSGIRTSISDEHTDFEIYDVVNDPKQTLNLADSLPDLQTEMKELAITSRRPGAGVTRPYDNALMQPVDTTFSLGLVAQSYQGIWPWVPEFRDLEVTSSFTVSNLDLSIRPRTTNYGVLFTGYINAPTDGNYTFHLTSDSGAQLFIHDAHVIDDDYLHTGDSQSGSVQLAAGLHPIRLHYRHSVGSENLNLEWQGPGITRAAVPDSVFFNNKEIENSELWIPFNESAGLNASRATGDQVGSLVGFSGDDSQWVIGKHGYALDFDGIDDEVSLGLFTPPSGTEDRTVAAWINVDTPGAITAWGNATTGAKLHFRIENAVTNTGALRLEVQGGAIVGTTDLRGTGWQHVAFTFENDGTPNIDDALLYLNGIPETIASVTPQAINTAPSPVTVGVDSQNRYFDGSIDELHIFRRALNAAEINALVNATSQVSEAWHYANFGSVIDFSIDDDGDGFNRLAEFAFGGDPLISDTSVIQPEIRNAEGSLKLKSRRRTAGKHGLTYRIMTSDDLQNWLPFTPLNEDSVTSVTDDIEEVVSDLGPLSNAPRFLRFEASQ